MNLLSRYLIREQVAHNFAVMTILDVLRKEVLEHVVQLTPRQTTGPIGVVFLHNLDQFLK